MSKFPEPRQLENLFGGNDFAEYTYSKDTTAGGNKAEVIDGYIVLRYPYSETLNGELKKIRGAHFNPEVDAWRVRPWSENVQPIIYFLRWHGFVFSSEVTNMLREVWS